MFCPSMARTDLHSLALVRSQMLDIWCIPLRSGCVSVQGHTQEEQVCHTAALRRYSLSKGFAGCSSESFTKVNGDAPSR